MTLAAFRLWVALAIVVPNGLCSLLIGWMLVRGQSGGQSFGNLLMFLALAPVITMGLVHQLSYRKPSGPVSRSECWIAPLVFCVWAAANYGVVWGSDPSTGAPMFALMLAVLAGGYTIYASLRYDAKAAEDTPR